jgi:hypothetical protein
MNREDLEELVAEICDAIYLQDENDALDMVKLNHTIIGILEDYILIEGEDDEIDYDD